MRKKKRWERVSVEALLFAAAENDWCSGPRDGTKDNPGNPVARAGSTLFNAISHTESIPPHSSVNASRLVFQLISITMEAHPPQRGKVIMIQRSR
jgi:hypothetical protein